MAAALPALAVAGKSASESASSLGAQFLAAMSKPIYQDVRTTVTTHVTEKGYVVTESHTKGFTIPLGLVVGTIAAVAAWEALTNLAAAFGEFAEDAADIIEAPILIALDELGVVVDIGTWVASSGGAVKSKVVQWQSTGTSMPSTATVKTVTVPATGMAGLSQLMATLLAPGSALASQLNQRLQAAIP